MNKTHNTIVSLFCGFLLLVILVSCVPKTPTTKNELWEVTILSAKEVYGWNKIDRFAGASFIVLDLKFRNLKSTENVTVPVNSVNLYGYNNLNKQLLGISKDSDTKLTVNGVDVSEITFLYCEAQPFSDYGCSYNVSMPGGGLPDESSLKKIGDALKQIHPIMNLEIKGDTLYVTLAFDNQGGSEDLVFKFAGLPPVTFSAEK